MSLRFSRRFLLTTIAVFGLCFSSSLITLGDDEIVDKDVRSSIFVDNYDDAEVIHYPLALLKGRAPGVEDACILVENLSSSSPRRISRSRVLNGRFKVLTELTEGLNFLSITTSDRQITFTLFYRKSLNPYFVELVCFFDCNSSVLNGSGSSQFDILKKKLIAASSLWRTAIAETCFTAGCGRKTFTLKTDEDGTPVVRLVRGKLSAEEYLKLSVSQRFQEISAEVISGAPRSNRAVYFVLVVLENDSDVDAKSQSSKRRIALGRLGVAMLDFEYVRSWPESYDLIDEAFSDSASIPPDDEKDSAYRNVRWALASSTLGAGLHELGHAFGLDHSDDPCDFMSRGFDHFNRIFSVYEPPSVISPGGEVDDASGARWGEKSLRKLMTSRWIQ